jgi:hypothetical protein
LGQLGSLGSGNQGRRRGGSQLCRGRPV